MTGATRSRAATGRSRGSAWRSLRRCVAVMCAVLASASCAPAPDASTSPPGMPSVGSPVTAPSTVPSGDATDLVVRAGLTEWTLEFSEEVLPAGTFRMVVTNTGATGHDLLLRGRAGVFGTPIIPPGGSAEIEVTTVAGETVEALCTVTGHHTAGMHQLLRVADA